MPILARNSTVIRPGLLQILLLGTICAASLLGIEPSNALAELSATNTPQKNVARKVDVNEFERLWKEKKSVVLDVRTDKEFAAGHIPGALHLPIHSPEFETKLSTLNKERTYLVHCAAGVRSARACETMSRLGFTNLVDLPSGFRAWEKAGKPVQK